MSAGLNERKLLFTMNKNNDSSKIFLISKIIFMLSIKREVSPAQDTLYHNLNGILKEIKVGLPSISHIKNW